MILILVYNWEIQDKNCYHGIQFLEQWKQQQQHQGDSYLYTLYVVGVYLKKSWVKKKLKWNEWNKIK